MSKPQNLKTDTVTVPELKQLCRNTTVNNGLSSSAVNTVYSSGFYIFAGANGIFSSTDNGASWASFSNGLPSSIFGFYSVYALLMNGSKLFAGTVDGVYSSTDYGANWTLSSSGITDKVNSLVMGSSGIFAGTEKGILVTSDNGATWISANNGLTNTDVLTLAFGGSSLFAGTNGGGVFVSSDNGASWSPLNSGLSSNAVVYSFIINGSDLFAGIKDGGVWKLTGSVR